MMTNYEAMNKSFRKILSTAIAQAVRSERLRLFELHRDGHTLDQIAESKRRLAIAARRFEEEFGWHEYSKGYLFRMASVLERYRTIASSN